MEARTLTVWQSKTRSTLVVPLHRHTIGFSPVPQAGTARTACLGSFFVRRASGRLTKYAASFVSRRMPPQWLPIAQYLLPLRHAFASAV